MNGNVRVTRFGDALVVSGDTYPIKTALKQLGFRWRRQQKVWRHDYATPQVQGRLMMLLGQAEEEPHRPPPHHQQYHNEPQEQYQPNVHFYPSRSAHHPTQPDPEDYGYHQGFQVVLEDVEEKDARPAPVRNHLPQTTQQQYRQQAPPPRHPGQFPRAPSVEQLYVDQTPMIHLEVHDDGGGWY